MKTHLHKVYLEKGKGELKWKNATEGHKQNFRDLFTGHAISSERRNVISKYELRDF